MRHLPYLLLMALAATPAFAQPMPNMPGMDMPKAASAPPAHPAHGEGPSAPSAPTPHSDMDAMPGMDHQAMPGMDHEAGMMGSMPGMSMSGALGSYPMTRDASGTSWQPDLAEHAGGRAGGGGGRGGARAGRGGGDGTQS